MCFIFGIGALAIDSNFSIKIWLSENDQRILNLDEHEKTFGNSDSIDIIIHNKSGVFNKVTLKALKNITEEMWGVSDIVRVESLSNYNWISSIGDDINITPFLDNDNNYTDQEINDLKQQAFEDENVFNNFVSKDSNIAYIRAILKVSASKPNYKKVVHEVESLITKYAHSDYSIHLSGIAYINESLNRASNRDMLLIFPLVCSLIVIIMFFYFRSFTSISLTFVVIVFSILSTIGLEGHLGIEFNNILAVVPAVLIAIGLADSIHILISYRHYVRYENYSNITAAQMSLKKNFIPTVLTSITTCIGFYSFLTTNITPIFNLGLLAGTGCLFTWIFTYFILGGFLKYIDFPIKTRVKEKVNKIDILLEFISKYKNSIILSSILISCIMLFAGLQNTINSDTIEYFSDRTDIKKTFNLVDKSFGGSRAIELVFDSEQIEGIKDVDFLNKANNLITWIEGNEEITRVASILPILKKMNKTLHSDQNEYYSIAQTRPEISDQLFLYTFGLPSNMDLKNQISLNNQKLRVIIIWNIKDTMNSILMTKKILKKAKELEIRVIESGQSPIYNHLNDLIVLTFYKSMGLTLPIIFLIMLLTFRSVNIALLSLIPNIVPLIIASGIMYLNGDEINIGNIIVFAVCMGIAVDDTIHLISNYQLRIRSGLKTKGALRETLLQTGKALILTTLLLVVGFGMFIIGDFVPNQKFGIYCSLILTLALFTDLILLPAILLRLNEKKL